MNGIEYGERTNVRLGRIVAPARQDGGDGIMDGRIRQKAAAQASAHLGQMAVARMDEVGPFLKVTRIARRLAIYQSGMRGGDEKLSIGALCHFTDQGLNGFGELMKANSVLHQI